jgi:uncharacterized protein (DUF362 family)
MRSRYSGTTITRRDLLKVPAAAALAGAPACGLRTSAQSARTGIYRVGSYRESLADVIGRALSEFPEVARRARGSRVVLKPNLVEYHDSWRVNTNPAVVAGAIAAFRAAGAKEVIVAEGPGHCRDTELLLEQSDLEHAIRTERSRFLDLNLDDIRPVALSSNYTKLSNISFSRTLLGADLIVSLPKLKTHHWAGVTLSLKNMFGTVPGVQYGWPKNILHWRGIENSIVDINVALKPHFAIVDGIEAMEGDGPLRGETVPAGVIIAGDNPTAVDATATRLMGLYPERVKHLQMMAKHGGVISENRIAQIGETIAQSKRDFRVLDDFRYLKQRPNWITNLIDAI